MEFDGSGGLGMGLGSAVYNNRQAQHRPMKLETDSMVGVGIQLSERQQKMFEARRKGMGLLDFNSSIGNNGNGNGGAQVQPSKLSSFDNPPHQKQQQPHDILSTYDKLKKLGALTKKTATTMQNPVTGSVVSHDGSDYWAQQPTQTGETAPMTTWSESYSEAGESAGGSRAGSATFIHRSARTAVLSAQYSAVENEAAEFYGQRLSGSDKQLYDDTGAIWNDSKSDLGTEVASLSSSGAKSNVSRSVNQRRLSAYTADDSRSDVSSSVHHAKSSVGGSAVTGQSESSVSVHSRQHQSSVVLDDEVRDDRALMQASSGESTERAYSRSETLRDEESNDPPPLPKPEETSHQSTDDKSQRMNKFRKRLTMKRQQQQQQEEKEKPNERTQKAGSGPHKDLLSKLLSSSLNQTSAAGAAVRQPENKDARDDREQNTFGEGRAKSNSHHAFALPLRKMAFGGKPPKSGGSVGSGSSISQKDKEIMRSVLARSQNKQSKDGPKNQQSKDGPSSPKAPGLIRSTSNLMKQFLSSPKPSPRATEETTLKSVSGSSSLSEDKEVLKPMNGGAVKDSVARGADEIHNEREQSHVLSRPIDLSRVASRVMGELIENSSDDDEEDDKDSEEEDELFLREAKPIRSFASVIKGNEIELKISTSDESRSAVDSTKTIFREGSMKPHSPTGPSNDHHLTNVLPGLNPPASTGSPEKYGDFVNALKADLAGSHTQLYEGFHAMFQKPGDDVKTPKPLSVYPGSLDLKSKEAIAKMDMHLKKNTDVDWVPGSQMTSDRELQMSPRPGDIGFGPHLLHSTKDAGVAFHAEKIQPIPQGVRRTLVNMKHLSSPPAIVQNDSMDTISAGPEGAEFEVTLTQHIRKSIAGQKTAIPQVAKHPASGGANQKEETKKTVMRHHSPKESISLSDIKLRSVCNADNGKGASTKIPASWTEVKLRKVAPKSPTASKTSPCVVQDDAEQRASGSFHRILLRRTHAKTSNDNNVPEIKLVPSSISDVTGTDNKPIEVASTVVSGTNEKPIDVASTVLSGTDEKPIDVDLASTVASGTDEKPIEVACSVISGSDNKPIHINDGASVGHPIFLSESIDNNSVCQPVQPVDFNEGSIMVALSKDDGSDMDKETKLIIGRDGMMKVEGKPGDSKVQVLWRLSPDDIQSALLDMSTYSVKLLVSSASKENRDLSFPSSEQCMQFVNALHEMTNSASSQSETSSTSSDDALYVEQLSEEEQRVLEEFRLRKSQPAPPPPPPPPHNDDTNQDFRAQLLAMTALKVNRPLSVVATQEMAPPSPLSEVSGPNHHFSLSAEDRKTAETYQKMLRMKIPKGAVQQKMIMNSVSSKIMEHVLGGIELTSPKANKRPPALKYEGLSSAEEEIANKYRKMLKLMVPAEAVRHKMQKDGVDSKIVAAVLGDKNAEGYVANVSSPVNVELNFAEQAIAETYRKMLKMQIPKEAVEHKMKKDGIAQKIIFSVVGKTEAGKTVKPAQSNSLTSEEELIASRYRKLLKLNIPRDELRFRMTQEGIAQNIITSVLGNLQNKKDQAVAQKRGFNKHGFHWTEVDEESISGSVWSKAKPMSETGVEKPEDIIDITKHIEMFQKQPDDFAPKTSIKRIATEQKKEMAKLIDLNRANNVAITLKAFNDFSMKDLAKVVEYLDPCGKIKGDRALFMKDLLPTISEAKAIREYEGSDDMLIVAEKWFKEIVHIKRIEDKIEIMRIMETFKMDTIVLGKSFQLLTKVCNQVMDSDRLPDLLEMVRDIGNRMNAGRGEAAAGFKLDFLPRLIQTKGSDKKTTALDLVVMIFITKNNREALNLSADFPDCQEASRVQLSDLISDVRDLEGCIRKTKKELDQLQKEHDLSETGKPARKPRPFDPDSRSDTAVEKPLSTLPFSREDGVRSEASNSTYRDAISGSKSPRASLMATLHEKTDSESEFTISASIRRLEKFISEAEYVHLARLQQDRDTAIEACRNLASFFCESGGEKAASNLLKILDEFARHIDQAVQKYDFQQKRKAAEQQRKAAAEKAPPAPETPSKERTLKAANPEKKAPPNPERSGKCISQDTSDHDTEKKSLVLMVNEMLKVAGDTQIKDFVEGRVTDNPDSRLQQIYEAERARKGEQFTSPVQRDILSAIKQRRGKNRESLSHQGLSDLRAKLENSPSNKASGSGCRRSSIADRWSSTARKETVVGDDEDDNDLVSEMIASNQTGRQKSGVTERWGRKSTGTHVQISRTSDNSDIENEDPYEKTDSEILASSSIDTEDAAYQQRRRQSYMNRWAAGTPASEASPPDLDDESDVGAFEETVNRNKQRYASRWARNPKSSEELLE